MSEVSEEIRILYNAFEEMLRTKDNHLSYFNDETLRQHVHTIVEQNQCEVLHSMIKSLAVYYLNCNIFIPLTNSINTDMTKLLQSLDDYYIAMTFISEIVEELNKVYVEPVSKMGEQILKEQIQALENDEIRNLLSMIVYKM
uniref:Uncharacterized protein n=1 Tax=Panagrolaimus sp. PS1159 TaxID=55785 RepID=A0AC35GXI4_9BILA